MDIVDLVLTINKECHYMYGYEIFSLRDIIHNYCEINDILVDTKAWDDLMNTLWYQLKEDIQTDFTNIKEMEDFLCEGIV